MKRGFTAIFTGFLTLALIMNLWAPIGTDAASKATASEGGNSGVMTPTEEKNLVTEITLKNAANVAGGGSFAATWVGMKVTVGGTDLVLTDVGRYYTSESSSEFQFVVLNEKCEVVVDGLTATVPEGAEEGFVYAKLEETVILQKDKLYYIGTYIKDNADKFYDYTYCATTEDASIDGFMVYDYSSDTDSWSINYNGSGTGNAWGPLDIKYEITKPYVQTAEKTFITDIDLLSTNNNGTNTFGATFTGMKITVGDKDMVITELGRYYTANSRSDFMYWILNEDFSTYVSAFTIKNTVPEGTEAGFYYTTLDNPITLKKNTTYFITTHIKNSSDMFYDYTQCTTTDDAVIEGFPLFTYNGSEWVWSEHKSANNCWGPVNFKYEIKEEVELIGNSVTLDGDIGLNCYVNIADTSDAAMLFTLADGSTQTVTDCTYNKNKDAYVYTCNLPAKHMTDVVKAQLLVDGLCSDEYEFSIKEYANKLLNEGVLTDEMKTLVINMLHYGAYAQKYFAYNTDNLADEGLEPLELSDVTQATFEKYATNSVVKAEGFGKIVASNLDLKAETSLNVYIQLEDGINAEDFTFQCGETTLEQGTYGDWIVVTVSGIAANELDEIFTIKVVNKANAKQNCEFKYSAFTYAYNALNENYTGRAGLKELMKAMYKYNMAADIAEGNWMSDGELKILAIGNSFSVNSTLYLYDLATDCGAKNVVVGCLWIPGSSLDNHADNAVSGEAAYLYHKNATGTWQITGTAAEKSTGWVVTGGITLDQGIADEDWDFITINGNSVDAGLASGYTRLDELIQYIQGRVSDKTKIVWNMTWAYQQDYTDPRFATYGNDQMTMYSGIVNMAQSAVSMNDRIDLIIPTGTAIQNTRTSYVGDAMTADGYHLNNYGCYVASMTYARILTGLSIDNVTYAPSGVDVAQRATAIEAVNNAIAKPYVVTNSSYTVAPAATE